MRPDRRRTASAREALAARWLEVARLSTRAARGDVEACFRIAAYAEEDGHVFDPVASRTLEACVAACTAEATKAGQLAGWPSSLEDATLFRDALTKLGRLRARASSFVSGQELTRACFVSALTRPVETRFISFFEGSGAVAGKDRPEVPARWLAEVFTRAKEVAESPLLDDALDELRCVAGQLCSRLARRALPFTDAHDAKRHIAAYAALEAALYRPGLLVDGPLAAIAANYLEPWAQADASEVQHCIDAALTLGGSTQPRSHTAKYVDAAAAVLSASFPSDASFERTRGARGLVSWEVVSVLLSTLARYQTLAPSSRTPLERSTLDAATKCLALAAEQASRTLSADDINAVAWMRIKNENLDPFASATQRWLDTAGLHSVLDDVAAELEFRGHIARHRDEDIDDDLYASAATRLESLVDAFAEKIASFSRSIARTTQRRHGSSLATDKWLEAFLTEANDRLCTRAVNRCRIALLRTTLADLLHADLSPAKLAARARGHYLAFSLTRPSREQHELTKDDARPFLDVVVVATLDHSRRRALLDAFCELCLDAQPVSARKRQADLDAALALIDDALDEELRGMLAATGVLALQPRAAAALLFALVDTAQ